MVMVTIVSFDNIRMEENQKDDHDIYLADDYEKNEKAKKLTIKNYDEDDYVNSVINHMRVEMVENTIDVVREEVLDIYITVMMLADEVLVNIEILIEGTVERVENEVDVIVEEN